MKASKHVSFSVTRVENGYIIEDQPNLIGVAGDCYIAYCREKVKAVILSLVEEQVDKYLEGLEEDPV